MTEKLMSRKFWLAAAAFLASLGTGLAGLACGDTALAMAGGICTVVSTAIYCACEAAADVAAIKADTTTTTKTVSATTTTAKTVEKLAGINE